MFPLAGDSWISTRSHKNGRDVFQKPNRRALFEKNNRQSNTDFLKTAVSWVATWLTSDWRSACTEFRVRKSRMCRSFRIRALSNYIIFGWEDTFSTLKWLNLAINWLELATKWLFWPQNGCSGHKMVVLATKWLFWQQNGCSGNKMAVPATKWLLQQQNVCSGHKN